MTKRIHAVNFEGIFVTGSSATVADDFATPSYYVEIAADPSPGVGKVAMAVDGAWVDVDPPPLHTLFYAIVDEMRLARSSIGKTNIPFPFGTGGPPYDMYYDSSTEAQLAILAAAAIGAKAIAEGATVADYDWYPGITGFTWQNIFGTEVPKDAFDMVEMAETIHHLNGQIVRAVQAWTDRLKAARTAGDPTDMYAVREELKIESNWFTE